MTSFEKELMGSRGFSLVPPNGLNAIISTNPWLLLPSKSMLAYAKKQSLLSLSGMKRRKGGIGTPVTILRIGKRKLK